jgi:hypothetical protein
MDDDRGWFFAWVGASFLFGAAALLALGIAGTIHGDRYAGDYYAPAVIAALIGGAFFLARIAYRRRGEHH